MVAGKRLVRPIPISPHQKRVIESQAWLTGFTGGRNAGKSKVGAIRIAREARKDWPCMAVGPDKTLVKDTFTSFVETVKYTGQYLKDVTTPIPKVTFRTLDDGVATIVFKGAHEPDSLRGPNIAILWFDEASIISKEAFEIAIGMCRYRRRLSPVIATFTPKGFKHWTFEKFFQKVDLADGQSHANAVEFAGNLYVPRKNTNLIHCATRDNPFAPAEYVETIGGNYSQALKSQELEGMYLEIAGLMFSRANFKLASAVPAGCVRYRYWDKASTPGDGCYSAGALVAKAEDGRIFIEHMIRGQWSPAERNRVMLQIAEQDARRYNGSVTTYIEREGGSSGGEINNQLIIMLGQYPVYSDSCMVSTKLVGGVKLPGDAKIRRAMPLAGQVENGNVYIVAGDWNGDFLDELTMFPEYRHCDQVDAVSACYNKLANLPSGSWQAQRYNLESSGAGSYGRTVELSGSSRDHVRDRLPWNR